jgi:hypothetical protein
MPSVYEEISTERNRQILLGYTEEHDDEHTNGSIADAAAAYATRNRYVAADLWPYDVYPSFGEENRRASLIKAAALIVAEVERMDRATHP